MKLPKPVLACLLLVAAGVLTAGTVTRIEYFFDSDPGLGLGTAITPTPAGTVDINQLIGSATLSDGFHRLHVRARNNSGNWGLPQSLAFYKPYPPQIAQPPYGTVSRLEYYFDSDPGLGLGTAIIPTPAGTVDLNQLVATATLGAGFHRIHVRARNAAGKWGLPQSTAFYIPLPAQPGQPPYGTVSRIEYYFDSDPGLGLGTILSLTPGSTVDINQLIATATLGNGFHRIHVRARNATGKWGLPQSMAFYKPIPTQPSGPYKNITHLEYWLDTDPGPGLGTVVPLSPASNINANVTLDLSGIPHGNHKLFIRLKNNAGQWGFPAYCLFSDGVPAHLTVSVTDGVLTVSWEDLYTIDTYKVYTATLPEGSYSEATGGSYGPSSWSAPFTADPKRFFRVTSIYTLE